MVSKKCSPKILKCSDVSLTLSRYCIFIFDSIFWRNNFRRFKSRHFGKISKAEIKLWLCENVVNDAKIINITFTSIYFSTYVGAIKNDNSWRRCKWNDASNDETMQLKQDDIMTIVTCIFFKRTYLIDHTPMKCYAKRTNF